MVVRGDALRDVVRRYPFGINAARDFRSTISAIRSCDYAVCPVTDERMLNLIQRIFVVDTAQRIDIPGIQAHPGFSPTAAEFQKRGRLFSARERDELDEHDVHRGNTRDSRRGEDSIRQAGS